MADKTQKQDDNVPGKFYVDKTCTGCSTCTAFAPENFAMNDDMSHARVIKQPENQEETDASQEALDSCPNGSIGNDGEE